MTRHKADLYVCADTTSYVKVIRSDVDVAYDRVSTRCQKHSLSESSGIRTNAKIIKRFSTRSATLLVAVLFEREFEPSFKGGVELTSKRKKHHFETGSGKLDRNQPQHKTCKYA